MKKNSECETPATGTEEFTVWWESQYAPAESHFIKGKTMNENIEIIDGTSLELNAIFYELSSETYELERLAMENDGDFVGK